MPIGLVVDRSCGACYSAGSSGHGRECGHYAAWRVSDGDESVNNVSHKELRLEHVLGGHGIILNGERVSRFSDCLLIH